jgi:hypothetical protein
MRGGMIARDLKNCAEEEILGSQAGAGPHAECSQTKDISEKREHGPDQHGV